MKKIIAAITIAASLTACSGFDHNECRNNVVKEVGTQDVVEIRPYVFVAKDASGKVWHYETMNSNDTKVTKKQPLF